MSITVESVHSNDVVRTVEHLDIDTKSAQPAADVTAPAAPEQTKVAGAVQESEGRYSTDGESFSLRGSNLQLNETGVKGEG